MPGMLRTVQDEQVPKSHHQELSGNVVNNTTGQYVCVGSQSLRPQ